MNKETERINSNTDCITIEHKSSLEISIENSEELIEYFKDKWTTEELNRQLIFLEQAKYNLENSL